MLPRRAKSEISRRLAYGQPIHCRIRPREPSRRSRLACAVTYNERLHRGKPCKWDHPRPRLARDAAFAGGRPCIRNHPPPRLAPDAAFAGGKPCIRNHPPPSLVPDAAFAGGKPCIRNHPGPRVARDAACAADRPCIWNQPPPRPGAGCRLCWGYGWVCGLVSLHDC